MVTIEGILTVNQNQFNISYSNVERTYKVIDYEVGNIGGIISVTVNCSLFWNYNFTTSLFFKGQE